MRHITFEQSNEYPVAVLVKASAFREKEIYTNYIDPLIAQGIPKKDLIAFTLDYDKNGKAPASYIKEYLGNLLPALKSINTKYLLVSDSAYFKVLTKQSKTDPCFGYSYPCAIKGFEDFQVILTINYQVLIFNPDQQNKLDLSLKTLSSLIQGNYSSPGSTIIHSASYPQEIIEIQEALESLHQYPSLAVDIEGFSLRFNEAWIGTIAFAWDQHNGIAIRCDYSEDDRFMLHGTYQENPQVRALLKHFFTKYKGTLIWHNASYDLKAIIYTLWMKDLLDYKGMLHGLDIMTRSFHDTKIIAYLSTNSTTGNSLGLKALAHEFAGNWANDDIKDIRKIPLNDLLQYNLVDTLSTNYVFNKHYPILVEDNQKAIYEELMLPSLKTIIQMELCGMPMNALQIQKVKQEISDIAGNHLDTLTNSPIIKTLNLLIQTSAMEAANAKLKTKQHPLEKFSDLTFNPGSGPQVQRLLYEMMGLPVIDKTATGQPATGADTIEKLLNHVQEPAYKELLEAIIGYGKATKILSTFIPAFENGILKFDGAKYLHGSFNLGGTVSGRLSSSDPNMQNLPAGSTYGTLIKTCFAAPKGWLFAGADFASLEDRINALLTKDPNKLKVYTDGYDGHSLRAYAYFKDQMPDIEDTVESINSIADKYKHLRQDSKSPTFALTYQGTWMTLVKNLGWSEDKAKSVEANYHKLYEVSTQWVKERISEASKQGYAEAAFGLRIRTPLLKQSLLGTSISLREAEAEGRTLGNAISGQSYGLLTNRALNAFMQKVWESKYRYDVLPVAMIHDAIYLMIKDNLEVVEWVNKNLTQEMSWQELPEIQHDQVTIGAELDIFWPNWANGITLPNDANQDQILAICAEAKAKFD